MGHHQICENPFHLEILAIFSTENKDVIGRNAANSTFFYATEEAESDPGREFLKTWITAAEEDLVKESPAADLSLKKKSSRAALSTAETSYQDLHYSGVKKLLGSLRNWSYTNIFFKMFDKLWLLKYFKDGLNIVHRKGKIND